MNLRVYKVGAITTQRIISRDLKTQCSVCTFLKNTLSAFDCLISSNNISTATWKLLNIYYRVSQIRNDVNICRKQEFQHKRRRYTYKNKTKETK